MYFQFKLLMIFFKFNFLNVYLIVLTNSREN